MQNKTFICNFLKLTLRNTFTAVTNAFLGSSSHLLNVIKKSNVSKVQTVRSYTVQTDSSLTRTLPSLILIVWKRFKSAVAISKHLSLKTQMPLLPCAMLHCLNEAQILFCLCIRGRVDIIAVAQAALTKRCLLSHKNADIIPY